MSFNSVVAVLALAAVMVPDRVALRAQEALPPSFQAGILLLAHGRSGQWNIEQGIRKRLDGLSYTMATQALIPDVRIQEWVLEQARTAGTAPLQ